MIGGNDVTEELILNECERCLKEFSRMSDTEIYKWLCDNYACKDYELLRKCSFILHKNSRNV